MRRRDFVRVVVSLAAGFPFAARAQQREQKRRVAILMGGLLSGDLGGQAEAAALEAGLTELGWKLGSNTRILEMQRVRRASREFLDDGIEQCGFFAICSACRALRPSGLPDAPFHCGPDFARDARKCSRRPPNDHCAHSRPRGRWSPPTRSGLAWQMSRCKTRGDLLLMRPQPRSEILQQFRCPPLAKNSPERGDVSQVLPGNPPAPQKALQK
jgi:hypothetical protein